MLLYLYFIFIFLYFFNLLFYIYIYLFYLYLYQFMKRYVIFIIFNINIFLTIIKNIFIFPIKLLTYIFS